jgi:hypothetical protein
MKHIKQFPHCDPRILHAPEDNCEFCNMHPEWQELRQMWGIAFTGHSYDKQGNPLPDGNGGVILPCPAQYNRGMTSVNGWHGNVAFTPEVKQAFDEGMERLSKDLAERFGIPEDEF